VSAAVYALAAAAVRAAPEIGAVPVTAGVGFIWSFLATFAAATAILILLLRTIKNPRFFAALLALAVFTGVATLFDALIGSSSAILATAVAVLLYYGFPRVIVFDIVVALGLAGIAANLGGAIRPTALVIILAVLAVYDIVAVYVTGHMVRMAESLVQKKVFFAIILSDRLEGLFAPVADVGPGKGFYFLGTGDIALPAILVASAAQTSVFAASAVSIGALTGLAATQLLFRLQPLRKPLPALPPIALGATIGYLSTLIV